jgi:hypothetical protein
LESIQYTHHRCAIEEEGCTLSNFDRPAGTAPRPEQGYIPE